jgi:hypothetical protein
MAVTYKLIETVTVGSGGTGSIEFTSIPQTYTDLKVVMSARSNTADASSGYYFNVFLNGVSANRSGRYLQGNGSITTSGSYTPWGVYSSGDMTASVFSSGEMYIPNYTGSAYKSLSIDTVQENNASLSRAVFVAGLWSDTAAVTSITFTAAAGLFVQYSSASLYGIKSS